VENTCTAWKYTKNWRTLLIRPLQINFLFLSYTLICIFVSNKISIIPYSLIIFQLLLNTLKVHKSVLHECQLIYAGTLFFFRLSSKYVAKYALHHGNLAAVQHFSKDFPERNMLKKSTIRGWKAKYLDEMGKRKKEKIEVKVVPSAKIEQPLGEI